MPRYASVQGQPYRETAGELVVGVVAAQVVEDLQQPVQERDVLVTHGRHGKLAILYRLRRSVVVDRVHHLEALGARGQQPAGVPDEPHGDVDHVPRVPLPAGLELDDL
jgi:hypothetical protein